MSVLYREPSVRLRFGSQFFAGDALVLGTGVLGIGSVLESYYEIDPTLITQAIDIRRGRDRLLDTYNAGNATVTFRDESAQFAPGRVESSLYGLVWTGAQLHVSSGDLSLALGSPLYADSITTATFNSSKHVASSDKTQFDVRFAWIIDTLDDGTRDLITVTNAAGSSLSWRLRYVQGAGERRLYFQFTFDGTYPGTYAYSFKSDAMPFMYEMEAVAVRADWQPDTLSVNFYYRMITPDQAKTQINADDGWWYIGSTLDYAGSSLSAATAAFASWYIPGSGYVQVGASSPSSSWLDCVNNLDGHILGLAIKVGGTTTESFDRDNMIAFDTPIVSNYSTNFDVRGMSAVSLKYYEYYLFTGFIDSFSYEWGIAEKGCYVTVTAEDAFRILNLSSVETVTGAAALDLPGARIGQILDTIEYARANALIDTGDTSLQDDDGTVRSALSAIQTVEQSDLGAFYCDGRGRLNYIGRSALNERLAAVPQAFSDSSVFDPSYRQINVQYDDQLISNQASIEPAGSTPQVSTDSTSVTKYFLREFNRSGLIMDSDTDALYMAQTIVAGRSEPTVRVEGIGFDITNDPTNWATIVGLDLNYPITVTKDWTQNNDYPWPGRYVNLGQRLGIQGIAHSIRPDRWVTVLSTAEQLVDGFILDSAEWGELDDDTISY